MSKLLKGNAVYGATSYKLFTKSGDSYTLIDTVEEKNVVVKNTFGNKGYIDNSGNLVDNVNAAYEKYHSDMFNINELANGPGGYCVGAFDSSYNEYPKICFFADNTLGSFIKGVFVNEGVGDTLTVEQIRAYANGAKYVIFNSDTEKVTDSGQDVVYTYKGFEFDLEKYEFPNGTNYLVVKAIGEGGVDINGDGKIYTDSDYGGDANGNPLEYVFGTIYTNDASKWVQQSISNAGALSYPGDTGFNRSNIMAVEKFAAGETITVTSKSERLMVTLVSYDANGAFASRGSWVGLDPTGVNGEVSTTFTSENPFNVVIATNSETNYTLEQMLNIVTVIGNK